MKPFSLLILYCCFHSLLFSQETESIQTDRPDQTESSYLVPKNYMQAEIGFIYQNNNITNHQIDHPNILLKFGLSDRFELRLLNTHYSENITDNNSTYFNELGIGFKTKVCDEKKYIPKISLISHTQFLWSNANKKMAIAPDFRFTFLHSLRENLNLSYNLGMQWNAENHMPTFLYTISLAYAISSKIGAFIESYAFFEKQTDAHFLMDGGFTYLINKNIQIDISGGSSIHKMNTEFFISTGISFRKNLRRTNINILSY